MTRGADTVFDYVTPRGIKTGEIEKVPVIIVGAGPVGLTAALDLAVHGIKSILVDDNNELSGGSRAICWAKRTLEIYDRLGIGDRLVEKGVTWKVGRLFHRDREVYSFDLLPEQGHKMPAFINLPQWQLEQALVKRLRDFPGLADLRWKNKLIDVHQDGKEVTAVIETIDGDYLLRADYLLACDGAHSVVRKALNLEFAGEAFEERFLIADIVMKADFPSERWFWFDPPFHNGRTALLHRQPDNIYRIDLELGCHVDPEEEKREEKIIPRIKAMIGNRDFTFDWVSVYSLQCRKLDKFVHDRVVFAGDSAHVVSIFGARGGNSGIQDVDNLVWKLAAVLKGKAQSALLVSYDEERLPAAEENIAITSRTARFMAPRSEMEQVLREAVLNLAVKFPFARKLVNSGRLSTPHALGAYSLQTPANGKGGVAVGSPCLDAPHGKGWLLNSLGGDFCILTCGFAPPEKLAGFQHVEIGAHDDAALSRYGMGMTYLIRPDQHVAAKFSNYDIEEIKQAHARALGGRS